MLIHSRVAVATSALLLLACSCSADVPVQSPAIRLVESELRREYRTRYLTVFDRTPDTLVVRLTALSIVKGNSSQISMSRVPNAALARRALELLSPASVDSSMRVKTVVVEWTQSRRFGPITFDRADKRSVYNATSLLAGPPPETWISHARRSALVELGSAADSSP